MSANQLILQDTFQRSNVASGSWGTATDGNSWSLITGNAPDLSVSSNEGTVANLNWDLVTLGSTKVQDAEVLVRMASHLDNGVGVALRVVDSTDFIHFRNNSTQAWFRVQVSGVNNDYGIVSFSFTAGTFYWWRARVLGNNLYLKVWADGTIEPGAWTTTASMTSGGGIISAAGNAGLLINDGAGKVDHFTAYAASTYRSFIDASPQILQWAEWSVSPPAAVAASGPTLSLMGVG